MKSLKIFIISSLFCVCSKTSYSQTHQTIDSLSDKTQECLDKGDYMLGCAKVYYYQIDSLLNRRYNALRSLCNTTQKANLKNEQLKWLSKRDKQFEINRRKIHEQAIADGFAGGQDEEMIRIQTNTEFVISRVKELINKKPADYNSAK